MLASKDAPAWLTYLTQPISKKKPNVNPLTGKPVSAKEPAWLTTIKKPTLVSPKKPPVSPLPAKTPAKPAAPVATKPAAPKVVGTSSAVTSVHPAAAPANTTGKAPVATVATGSGIPKDDPWNGLTQKEVSEIIKRAKTGVSVELDPQIQLLKDQAGLTQKQAERLQAQSELATQKTVAEQKELYARLGNTLQGLQGQVGGNYDDAANKVGGNYAALQAALASRFGAAQTNANDEMARLGLQAAGPEATRQLTADSNFLQGLAGSDAAAAQTSIGMSKSAALQNLMSSIENSAASGTRLTAQTLQDALAATNERNASTSDALTQLLSQANALQSKRRGMEYEASTALQDQLRGSKSAAQQQAFDNALAQANLSIKAQLAGSDSAYKQALAGAAQTNAQANAAKAGAYVNKSNAELQKIVATSKPGTLEYEQAMAAINLKNSQTAKNITTTGYTSGIGGATQYLNQVGKDPVPGTGQTVAVIGTNMVNDIMNVVGAGSDSYDKARANMAERIGTRGYPSSVANALYHALAIAYGKSK